MSTSSRTQAPARSAICELPQELLINIFDTLYLAKPTLVLCPNGSMPKPDGPRLKHHRLTNILTLTVPRVSKLFQEHHQMAIRRLTSDASDARFQLDFKNKSFPDVKFWSELCEDAWQAHLARRISEIKGCDISVGMIDIQDIKRFLPALIKIRALPCCGTSAHFRRTRAICASNPMEDVLAGEHNSEIERSIWHEYWLHALLYHIVQENIEMEFDLLLSFKKTWPKEKLVRAYADRVMSFKVALTKEAVEIKKTYFSKYPFFAPLNDQPQRKVNVFRGVVRRLKRARADPTTAIASVIAAPVVKPCMKIIEQMWLVFYDKSWV